MNIFRVEFYLVKKLSPFNSSSSFSGDCFFYSTVFKVMHFFSILIILFLASCSLFANDKFTLDKDTNIRLLEGFDAELVYSVPKFQGSWVAMAFDPKGRLIVSDQDDKGVFRVTMAEVDGQMKATKVESLKGFPFDPIKWGKRSVGGALGFVYAFDSLYMSTMKGFFRCRDTDGDDNYDEFKLLKRLNFGYEHSAHSIIKTEDGKALYLVTGNYTRTPVGTSSRQAPVWKTDNLLQPMPDAMGHATRIKPPGGHICRISPDGEKWEMVASGLRNSVDMAINKEGELFTYDSDLEFDIGCPWYRPTRVLHVTSGSEFGWRTGTGKWREYFADSNGPVVNIGPGSPTGMSFGHHSNYPSEYQNKLFICDWTFGTIYTVDMTEVGSSYKGTHKEFLTGSPLNIAAMRFGSDGSMYFITGGRNTESKLYRIRYKGAAVKTELTKQNTKQSQREIRKSLEAFHSKSVDVKKAIEQSWPYLSSDDRRLAYAARIAIENQELSLWKEKVFKETNPAAIINAAMALCRTSDEILSNQVLTKLNTIDFSKLSHFNKLALLRAYSLCFIRFGEGKKEDRDSVIKKFEAHYPAKNEHINTELCRLLSYLNSPSVVSKTVALMKTTQAKTSNYNKEMLERGSDFGSVILKSLANSPNVQNIQYAYSLRRVKNGWSPEDRKYYFNWLKETLTKSGGKSFTGHVKSIRKDAISYLPVEERSKIAWLLGEVKTIDLAKLPNPKGPAVAWTVDKAMDHLKSGLTNRNYKNGKLMFSAGKCIVCHRIQGSGGYSGPDLGSVGNRYSVKDILTAIIDPNDSISEQYQASHVNLKDGSSIYGRLIHKNDKEVALAPSAFSPDLINKVSIEKVKEIKPSNISLMPPGMINGMNKDELLDLIAYLISGGDSKHPAFKSNE